MTRREELHGRSVDDDAFYEWFLSDHPDAAAERDWRREDHYLRERERAAEVRAWADKVNAQTDAPQTVRDLAASLGPLADKTAARAEVDRPGPTTCTSPGSATSTKPSCRCPGRWRPTTTGTPPTSSGPKPATTSRPHPSPARTRPRARARHPTQVVANHEVAVQ